MPHYPIHPACAVWPQISDAEIEALAADIKANGLIHPITLCDGKILDGRNRDLACEKAGIEPSVTIYNGNDPIGFSLSVNRHRRHLPHHQLAFIGEELSKLKQGTNRFRKIERLNSPSTLDAGKTMAQIGAELGLHSKRIGDARAVMTHGAPNVIAMAKKGEVPLQSAAAFARATSKNEQITASREEVKRRGHALAKHIEKAKQQMITIPLRDVVDKFHPLIKRVKEQSKRHTGTVSLTELGFIAHELKQLADSWTKGGSEVERNSKPAPSVAFTKGG